MSTEVTFLRFLKKLSYRDRKLYILLESYRSALTKYNDADELLQTEASSLLSAFFETEIYKLLESSVNPPIYESHRNDRAERSVSLKKPDKLSLIRDIDKQFDEKIGEWASSFSDDEKDVTEEQQPIDALTKRLSNASDLSSDDEQPPPDSPNKSH